MISGILFLSQKGEVLLSRMFRDGVTRQVAETFRTQVIVRKEAGRCPVQLFGNSSFMYVKTGSVFIVAVSQGNAHAAVAFQFLVSLVAIIKAYCGGDVNDDTIRNNFVLLYEVLDEVLDYGIPQNTTIDLLKNFITQQAETIVHEDGAPSPANITIQATGAISWRKEGIKYRKNELFIDVVEQCNLMVSSKVIIH
ncbi:Longin-like domain-containing protein [Pavlovales sp. CCMP2436]|nr:Longin-like domain-containing protein [Pavlovales sp. CCMP2436]